MVRRMSVLDWLVAVAAISFVAATVLFLGIVLDVFVTFPTFPDTADLPTRLLGSIPAVQAVWPYDFASTALFAVAFGATALIGRQIPGLGRGTDGARLAGGLLTTGATLGLIAQLIHVGAQQAAVDIPYCDCGFKVQEAISQHWGLVLIQGAQGWLVIGATLLFALGLIAAVGALAAVVRSAGWVPLSWLTALVGILSVVLSAAELGGDVGQWLTGLLGGILFPAWLILLARNAPRPSGAAPAA